MHSVESRCPLYRVVDKRLDMIEGVSKLKNSEKRQIVGAAGIPARSTASSRNLLSILLQCRRQECPRLLSLQKKAIRLNNQGKTMIDKDSFVPLL